MYVITWLTAIQLLATLRYGGAFLELTRVGVVRPSGLLLGAPASVCLYLAVILFLLESRYSTRFFAVAAIGLSFSTPFWWAVSITGTPFPWSIIVIAGALLGAAGWWCSHPLATSPQTAVHDPADD